MPRYIDADNINLKGISVFDQNLEILISLSDVRKALQMTPTADVQEVRHGNWVKVSEHMPIYNCSICLNRNLFKNGNNVFSNFCPHCGAKMDGEREIDTNKG